jgi:hypothetical protein
MQYIVTAIDIGDTCDGHSRLLGVFGSRKGAEDFVKEDMKGVLATVGTEDNTIIKWDAHEIWIGEEYVRGCMWDILEVALDSANAIHGDTVSKSEDEPEELGMPDEDDLLEVVADSLRRQGYKEVVNQCGSVFYEHDGKEGSIYLDITERDKED